MNKWHYKFTPKMSVVVIPLNPALGGRSRQISVSSRPAWSTWRIPVEPGLCRMSLSQKPQQKGSHTYLPKQNYLLFHQIPCEFYSKLPFYCHLPTHS